MMKLHPDGYVQVTHEGRSRLAHILVAEKALGKPLPRGAVVHHVDEDKTNNAPANLVICPDREYHMLIHKRMRAFASCGHYDWEPCNRCLQYDAPENMRSYGRQFHHVACDNLYQKQYAKQQRANRQLANQGS